MIRPNYRDFKRSQFVVGNGQTIQHSAEGIRGNGQERKDLLGENYEEVQKRVNKLMKGSASSKTIPSDKTKAISVAEEAAKKAVALVDAYRNKKTK